MKRKLAVTILTVLLLIAIWIWQNPIGRFGYHRFGLTVYSGIPFPAVDVVVHANGLPGIRGSKAHFISAKEFYRLIGPVDAWPEVVIIGTGYEDRVREAPDLQIRSDRPYTELLPTPQAIRRFNELRAAGKRVAAIIHSTC